MSTSTKKNLLARIAGLSDAEARDALNTLTMNLTTGKRTVIRDLEDALDNTTPKNCRKHDSKLKKHNKKTKDNGALDEQTVDWNAVLVDQKRNERLERAANKRARQQRYKERRRARLLEAQTAEVAQKAQGAEEVRYAQESMVSN